jgi:capsular exopolysaccharide synthesis family protein
MSEVYEALRRSGLLATSEQQDERAQQAPPPWELLQSEKPTELALDEAVLLQPHYTSQSRLVALSQNGNLGKEKFLVLSTHLKHLQEKRQLRRVVLTSSLKGDGKSVVAANLAISLARGTKQKVLLLEGDLRQPVLSQLLHCDEREGLSDWLQAQEAAAKFLCRLEDLPLWLLFAGIRRERPLELLQSLRLPQLLGMLDGWFDWIVIDAPPLVPLADASVWARLADGVLLVVRENQTPKKLLQQAMDGLGKSAVLGLVLNDARNVDEKYYKTYYANRGA